MPFLLPPLELPSPLGLYFWEEEQNHMPQSTTVSFLTVCHTAFFPLLRFSTEKATLEEHLRENLASIDIDQWSILLH